MPRLGAIAVSALRFEHIDAAVSGMIEDELASKTIHNTVTMLAGKRGPSAVRRGFAFHDPTMGLELPPLESRQITPPRPEQVWALIGAAKELGGLGYALAYMGAFTGLRRNEALGLRFNDIEWFGNEVNVRHAISKRRSTDGAHKWEWHLGPPKSRKSLRRIAATESVMKMLADLKVGKPDGAFRHFFASQLIAQGETAAYVRDQMGHSSIKVTFDTYGISSQAAARRPAPATSSRWPMPRCGTKGRPVLAIR